MEVKKVPRNLPLGFTTVCVFGEERPQCVICQKTSAERMKPNKLNWHLQSNRTDQENKPREYFVRKGDQIHFQKASLLKYSSVPGEALLALYQVSYIIAQGKKKHHETIENLILPAAIDTVTTMLRKSKAKRLLRYPLTNDIVSRRDSDIAADLNEELVEKTKRYRLQFR
jgi:hypothetical protein